jgi:Family of unknown function (DUF5317)
MLAGTLVLVLLVIDSAVVVGLLRGGRLDGLRVAHLKAVPLLLAALALQVLLGLPWHPAYGSRWGIGSLLLVASLLLLLIVVRANARLPGMPLVALGLLANLLVVGLNGGMPVSTTALGLAHTPATSADPSHLGPPYLAAGPNTRLPMLSDRLRIGIRTVVSVGDLLQYAGLFLLIQGLMVRGVIRRPKPTPPRSPWTTLLRVAWLAIVLGLLLQLALLLVAAGFGRVAGPRLLLAETCRTVCWSLLVCVGVALGRVAAKARVPLEGATGLLAAPLALTAANTLQKGVAEALNAAGTPAGPAPLWVLALKAAEYACLGLALGWIGRRARASALWYGAAGLVAGIVFGGALLAMVVGSAPTLPSTPSLLAKGVNELLFPIGCALVVFIAEVLGTYIGPAAAPDRLPRISFAKVGDQVLFPSPSTVDSHPVTRTVGPLCEFERGHWACLTHSRSFATRRSLDRHTLLGEHHLVWMCWTHGPEQPGNRAATSSSGQEQVNDPTVSPLLTRASSAVDRRHSGQDTASSQT